MTRVPPLHAPAHECVLLAIDIQPAFMSAIHEADRVVRRSEFMLKMAAIAEVPVIATVQNPARMGGIDERISSLLESSACLFEKMAFSCCGSAELIGTLSAAGRKTVVLVGIETHICVTLTALDLLSADYSVIVCPDAVSARSVEMHKLGMERMRDSGAMPSHTETLAYEWLGTASHPRFREALQVVKDAASEGR